MRRIFRTHAVGAMLLVLALVVSACSSGDGAKDGTTIEIASFGFGESEIVAEIYKQALEAEGYIVNHQV
ncbi:MAG: glycine/betaine ABC transporter substrate-binding protein, partial [Acidimicrobiia bacterium]|nr:glycine/betaine ABC transporter substrate-binding protein [Acidimicrobiia bacterium]